MAKFTQGPADPVYIVDSDGNQSSPIQTAQIGAVNETAPATDTASSGLNGRLQRIAQRLTALIALIPAALTGSGNFKVAVHDAYPLGAKVTHAGKVWESLIAANVWERGTVGTGSLWREVG